MKEKGFFIFAIGSGIILGMLIMLISGYNPLVLLVSMVRGTTGLNFSAMAGGPGRVFNERYIGEFLVSVMPLWMTGLAVAFAFRTGLFNIGAEGQVITSMFMSSAMAILFPPIPGLHLLVVILTGIIAGAVWGAIAGVLKAVFRVHEVVVTIMLNYVALYFGNYIIKSLPGSSSVKTQTFSETAVMHSDLLQSITNNSRVHWGIFLVIIAFFVYWFVMERSILGFSLKATGSNFFAAQHGGIHVKQNVIFSMTFSGAYAGIAGVLITIGTYDYGRVLTSFENFGFNGIAVALLGNNTGLGVFLSGLLFGSLQSAQSIMQVKRVPKDITIIIIAIIIFCIAMKNGFQKYMDSKRRLKAMMSSQGDVE